MLAAAYSFMLAQRQAKSPTLLPDTLFCFSDYPFNTCKKPAAI